MAITTDNGKLSVMEWCSIWEPGLPISPGTIDQADQQQFLWGFSEILWSSPVVASPGAVALTDAPLYGLAVADAHLYGLTVSDE